MRASRVRLAACLSASGFLSVAVAALALTLAGCGGGGPGGGSLVRIIGRILSVSTGGAPDPQASVQIGGTSVLTGAGDGVFVLDAPRGATTMVVTHPSFPSFIFTFPPVMDDADIGDFWIGPSTVRIDGSVLDSQDNSAVPEALVTFAGRRALTNSAGEFSLQEVAYDPGNEFVFFGIFGRIEKTGYVPSEFSINQSPQGGVITLPPFLIARVSDPNPPGTPYNLWGIVQLQGGGSPAGTIVTLLRSGTPVRRFNVGANGRYQFWASPDDYVLRFERTGYQTAEINVTGFTEPDQVIRNDVTLIPI